MSWSHSWKLCTCDPGCWLPCLAVHALASPLKGSFVGPTAIRSLEAKLLFEHKADPSAPDVFGCTPLHWLVCPPESGSKACS